MKNHIVLGACGALLLVGSAVAITGGRGISLQGTFLQSGTGAVLRTIESKERDFVSVKDFGAVGDGVADDTAAIQAAHAAVTDGGTIYLPCGTYKVTGEILITKRLQIIGAGWCSVLQVAASVGSSTDVIRIAPTSGTPQGFRFQDFAISPASGTPARYGINVDGTSVAIGYMTIDHVRIDTLGNYAVAVTNASGLVTGTPYTTIIQNSLLSGGVNLTNAGDNVAISRTVLTGPRDLFVQLVGPGASGGGAHGFMLDNSNVTLVGGVVVVNAWQGAITNSNLEQTATSTSSNNALIDIRGNTNPGPIENFRVEGNFLGANNLFVADAVRVDRAVATIIRGNLAVRGSGVTYRLTANADRTQLILNRQSPAGELITTWLADLGTNTQVEYIHPNSGAHLFTNPGQTTNAGVTSWHVNGVQVRTAANGVTGFSSTNDPTGSGLDSGMSRIGAGAVAFGNGTAGDATADIYYKRAIITGTLQTNLGTPGNGISLYCSDCTIANPCAGGGTGAIAKRLNGVWVCN